MKLISTTRLPFGPWREDCPPVIYEFNANGSHIVSTSGGSENNMHVLSSCTGTVLQRKQFKTDNLISAFIIDGESIIIANTKDSNLAVYHIPTE